MGDLNADGWDDVFITASMNFPFRYGVNSVLLNEGGKRFVDSEFILGVEPRRGGRTAKPWFRLDPKGEDGDHALVKERTITRPVEVWAALGTRSSAVFDLDEDGDLDIVTNEFNDGPMILVSDLSARKTVHFLKITLRGTRSNRDGLGAVVQVTTGSNTFTKVNDGVSGYLFHSVLPLYFGLGEGEAVRRTDIRWPSGTQQRIQGAPKSSSIRIREPSK